MDKLECSKILGHNVRTRRRELNITQDELAVKVGYTNKYAISKVENGNIDIPLSKLSLFAQALDCSMAYLINLDKEERYTRSLNSELGYQDVQLLTKFSMLSPEKKDIVSRLIDDLSGLN